jgi:hypothetical protein
MSSCVQVNGVKTTPFPVCRGTAQGCTLSPLLFDIFVDGLLQAVEDAGFGVKVGGRRVGGLMFADDFAGVESSAERLQQLIDVARGYLHRWGLRANVPKSAVVVYAPRGATGHWRWGGTDVPVKDSYTYLGVKLHSNCRWTPHVEEVLRKGRAALAKYSRLLRARGLPRHVRLLIYKQYVRPTLEYAAEVWYPTETQGVELERIQLKAARMVLGCFGATANVATLAELGLDQLAVRRRAARLRWYNKLRCMPQARLPAVVHNQSQEQQPRKAWRARLLEDWGRVAQGAEGQGDIDSFFDTAGSEFLRQAKDVVHQAAQTQQQQAMLACTTLQHLPYISLHCHTIQPYLKGPLYMGQGTDWKMQCRTGTLQVNSLLCSRRQVSQAACPLCGDTETISHFILHCPAYAERRTEMLAQLSNLITNDAVRQQFHTAGDQQKVADILSDRFWQRQQGLIEANTAVCSFLHQAWADRQQYLGWVGGEGSEDLLPH